MHLVAKESLGIHTLIKGRSECFCEGEPKKKYDRKRDKLQKLEIKKCIIFRNLLGRYRVNSASWNSGFALKPCGVLHQLVLIIFRAKLTIRNISLSLFNPLSPIVPI